MNVDFLTQGFDRTVGLSRYSESVLPELRKQCNVTLCRPRMPKPLQWLDGTFGDLNTFFSAFPLDYQNSSGDVLHISSQTMGLPLLYRDTGPTVVTVHDIFPYMFQFDTSIEPFEPWHTRGIYRLSMRALAEADQIISISDATKASLQQYLKIPTDHITRVHYGVDHDTFHPLTVTEDIYRKYGLDPNDRHVVYVGSERPRKAVPELIEAFASVTEVVPNATLIKVGGPEVAEERIAVKKAIKRHGVSENVVFTGHVEEDLAELYNLADVFASATYHEGFGLPFVEAMACGTPVAARGQSAMPEVVGDGGAHFDNTEELTEVIVRFLTDQEFRARKAEVALSQSKRFSWTKAARRTVEVYQRLA